MDCCRAAATGRSDRLDLRTGHVPRRCAAQWQLPGYRSAAAPPGEMALPYRRARLSPVPPWRMARCTSAAAITTSMPWMSHSGGLRWKFATRGVPRSSSPAVVAGPGFMSAATTATSTRWMPPAASSVWKFATEGERRFSRPPPAWRGAGRRSPCPIRSTCSCPRRWSQRPRSQLAVATAMCTPSPPNSGTLRWKFQDGQCRARVPRPRRRRAVCSRQLGQRPRCPGRNQRRAALALQDRRAASQHCTARSASSYRRLLPTASSTSAAGLNLSVSTPASGAEGGPATGSPGREPLRPRSSFRTRHSPPRCPPDARARPGFSR